MSNHHSDIDVDDVLSSVRRLVADESDEERRKRQEQAADRLVLTPSLRVADPEEAQTQPEDADPEPEEATETTQVAAPLVSEEDALDEAFEEEQHSEADPDETPDPIALEEASDEVDALTAELQSLENETLDDEDAALHGPTETSLRAISLEDRIAELEAAVNAQRDEFEPDGSEDQAQHVPDTALQSVPEAEHPEPVLTAVEPELNPETAPEAEVAEEVEPELATEPEDIDVAETPIMDDPERADTPEEPEASLDVGPAAALSFRHRGFGTPPVQDEASPQDEPQAHEADAEEPDDVETTVPAAGQDDAILDEDALRELVGQLVRQELQGDLGERITRNVRKLVRREIQIALAARSLEKD